MSTVNLCSMYAVSNVDERQDIIIACTTTRGGTYVVTRKTSGRRNKIVGRIEAGSSIRQRAQIDGL